MEGGIIIWRVGYMEGGTMEQYCEEMDKTQKGWGREISLYEMPL